jgi:hypothetical protein
MIINQVFLLKIKMKFSKFREEISRCQILITVMLVMAGYCGFNIGQLSSRQTEQRASEQRLQEMRSTYSRFITEGNRKQRELSEELRRDLVSALNGEASLYYRLANQYIQNPDSTYHELARGYLEDANGCRTRANGLENRSLGTEDSNSLQ